MKRIEFESRTKELIDDLKNVCASYGLGNDGNEFKIITQCFLYKFLNDKFVYEIKKESEALKAAGADWEAVLAAMPEEERDFLLMGLPATTAVIREDHYISSLYQKQNQDDFAEIFDNTLTDIASDNSDLFSVVTNGGEKVVLFERLSRYVTDDRDGFCRAIINKLAGAFSFEHIFGEGYDFYATIFEYLIKDYNTNSGGKYAEYFTPYAVSKIMARCLVQGENVRNVTCYDPSAGSGTLLMNLAHQIGEDNCSIYSQDISQKSSNLLRLNLILNNLVHSIPNIVKGNTLKDPYHKEGTRLRKFDFIVSNPPFKLDFSDDHEALSAETHHQRFFAGIPNIPKSKKESMAIYQLFLQHIIYTLGPTGKAAIVVPTGFITAQSGIDKKIRQRLVKDKMLAGVVSMPSNIFAATGTNVSILFLNKENKEEVVLIDASNLGTKLKVDGNQKTVLSHEEEERIIHTFIQKEAVDDFSVVVSYKDIADKNYSLSAGQYFEVKIEYTDITHEEFEAQMAAHKQTLNGLFADSRDLEEEIEKQLEGLRYE
ncbi:class I SAM-dependent DNA methyltransferase [Roseivirga sp. BDSF3-8]|uniref:HsdM family class I SAM-dependent methyltransferase n=1 Tax=Roseivirga sp. BDSF3-8 TaxID=3241598 RepID=UPI003531DD72